MKKRSFIAIIPSFLFLLSAIFLLVDLAGGPQPARAQNTTPVYICIGDGIDRDCGGRCISAGCIAAESRSRAENERRAKLTPEERAAEDARLKAKRDADQARQAALRDAEQLRLRRAAEAVQARELAERRAAEAAYKAKVDGQIRQFGLPESRRAEAVKLIQMREAAERAKPKPPARICTPRTLNSGTKISGKTQAEAISKLAGAVAHDCQARTGSSAHSLGAPRCEQLPAAGGPRPPVGKCLACINERLAAQMGWVPGKGWPTRAPPVWSCSVNAQCSKPLNDCGPSSVSAQ